MRIAKPSKRNEISDWNAVLETTWEDGLRASPKMMELFDLTNVILASSVNDRPSLSDLRLALAAAAEEAGVGGAD